MALIVGTNSYVSVAEADAYFATRYGYDQWSPLDDPSKEAALISAADQLDYMCDWICNKNDPDQPMEWPRCGDPDVPENIEYAQMEIAYQMVLEGVASQSPQDPVTELKAGSVSLKFENEGGTNQTVTDHTKNLLRGYGHCHYPGARSSIVDVARA